MGILYRQIRRDSVKRVEIVFAGKEIDDPADAKILSLVALKGILEGSMSRGNVNFVNAGLLAEQIGHRGQRDHLPGERRLPQPHPA